MNDFNSLCRSAITYSSLSVHPLDLYSFHYDESPETESMHIQIGPRFTFVNRGLTGLSLSLSRLSVHPLELYSFYYDEYPETESIHKD